MRDKIIRSMEIVKTIEDDNGYIGNNDFKVVELNNDKCIIEYEVRGTGLNPMGIVHGGLLFGLMDTACGSLAFMTGKNCVTTNGNINYLHPAKKGKLFVTATISKVGKSIGYYNAEIKDEKDNIIATGMINMYFLGDK